MEKNVKKVCFVDWSLKDEYNTVHHKEFNNCYEAETCADIILVTFGIDNLQLLQTRQIFYRIVENDE